MQHPAKSATFPPLPECTLNKAQSTPGLLATRTWSASLETPPVAMELQSCSSCAPSTTVVTGFRLQMAEIGGSGSQLWGLSSWGWGWGWHLLCGCRPARTLVLLWVESAACSIHRPLYGRAGVEAVHITRWMIVTVVLLPIVVVVAALLNFGLPNMPPKTLVTVCSGRCPKSCSTAPAS